MHRLKHLTRCGSILCAILVLVSMAACGRAATPAPQSFDAPITIEETDQATEPLPTQNDVAAPTLLPLIASPVATQVLGSGPPVDTPTQAGTNSGAGQSVLGA